MILVPVDRHNVGIAAEIHSASWQASHKAFCTAEFVARHTPGHQRDYILDKMKKGSRFYLLCDDVPVGIVSVDGNLIEDLYVRPERQNRGYGTRLLHEAMARCDGAPVLWILENNDGARRLYVREGFRLTGRRNAIADGLDEIELVYEENRGAEQIHSGD